MQNSFCKSPSLDYNKYTNISPLMPKFQSEKEKKDCENSDWMGFLNRNLISNNQSGKIKLNLDLSDIMTPQYQNKNDINVVPIYNFQNKNNLFNNINNYAMDKNFNYETDKKDETLIKSENFALPSDTSNLFLNHQSYKNKSNSLEPCFDNKKFEIDQEENKLSDRNDLRCNFPSIQSSILKTSDKRSSFTACSPKKTLRDNLIRDVTSDFKYPLNLTIINNNYFLHDNTKNNSFNNNSIESNATSNCLMNTQVNMATSNDSLNKVEGSIIIKNQIDDNEFFIKTRMKNNLGDKFKNQIKNIIKISEERPAKLGKKKTINRKKKEIANLYNRYNRYQINEPSDYQNKFSYNFNNNFVNKCELVNANSNSNHNLNHTLSEDYSELTLSNLIKNSASRGNNNLTKAKKKIKSDYTNTFSKFTSAIKSKRRERKGMRLKKNINNSIINTKNYENYMEQECYHSSKNTQILELNNVTMPILSNEIYKLDLKHKYNQNSNSKSVSNDEILFSGKLDKISKFTKIQRSKIPKGVKVELVEKNDFEVCDLKRKFNLIFLDLINPFDDSLDLNDSCNYFDTGLKNEYLKYLIYGKSNQKNMSFGSDPLEIYKDLTTRYLREKNKLENSSSLENRLVTLENFNRLGEKMNELNKILNTLPILRIPNDSKYLPYSSNITNNKKRKNKILVAENDKKFECKICHLCFDTGQGLGGHVSRIHQGQSENYNKKKATRLKREEERKRLYDVKTKILEKYGNRNYDDLIKQKHGKLIIKRVIEENYQEYVKLKREMKKEILYRKQ